MTPEQLAARWLADVPRYTPETDLFRLPEPHVREADALAAIARHLTPGDDLVERIAEPHDPGDFVGDIYFGHPVKTTMGTHRWTGTEWVALPSEAEALAGLLAEARKENATVRARLSALTAERDEAINQLDSAIHSVDVLEKRVATLRARLARMEGALRTAEAALADIGDAEREPNDDLAWCERRAADALPWVRAALTEGETE